MLSAFKPCALATLFVLVATAWPTHAQDNSKSPLLVYLRLIANDERGNGGLIQRTRPQTGDALVHELCRQSVLLATRDMGKPIARDEGMGDLEPEKNRENTLRFTVTSKYVPGESVDLQVDEHSGNEPKEVWKHHLVVDKDKHLIQQLCEALEEKSRNDLEGSIKSKLSFKQVDQKTKTVKTDFKTINALLDDLTFLSQYEALRRLHATGNLRDADTLAALVKGYAQLGLLTRYHWTHVHRICQARSLLYAQRLMALHPKSSGQSDMAACLGFAGYHGLALKLFEAAEKEGIKLSRWTNSARLAARFDFQSLQADGEKDEAGSVLSEFLAFRILAREPAYRFLELDAPAQKLGLKLFESKPELYPVIHRMGMSNSLGLRQHMTLAGQPVLMKSLPNRLGSMQGLPDKVTETFQTETMIRDCPQALQSASKLDTLEPSWASVGQAILQTYFHQALCRAEFMRNSWSVPTGEYLAEVIPLLENHPHVNLVKVTGGDRDAAGHPFTLPKTGDTRFLEMAQLCRTLIGDQPGIAMQSRFLNNRPQNGDDLALLANIGTDAAFRKELAKAILAESPYHPMGATLVFMSGNSQAESLLPADHEDRFGAHAPYLFEYGQWQIRNKKLDKAEKTLTKLVKINPNFYCHNLLARYYLQVNNRTKWESTLLAYLKTDDPGLQPAQARLDLAEYYADQKDWEKAKEYATAAADTYAGWALFRASRVFEKAGDWAQSEEYIRNMSTRYNDSTYRWFLWCIRTGKGKKEAACSLIKARFKNKGNLNYNDLALLGLCEEAMNHNQEALDYYTKSYSALHHIYTSVNAAIMEAELGNKTSRDNWLIKSLIPDKKQTEDPAYEPNCKLVEHIQEAYKTQKAPPIDTIDKLIAGAKEQNRPIMYYQMGRVAEQINDKEAAKAFFTKGTKQIGTSEHWHTILCIARLRTLSGK